MLFQRKRKARRKKKKRKMKRILKEASKMVSPKRPLDKNVMADKAFAVKLLVCQGHFRNAEAKKSKGAAKKKVLGNIYSGFHSLHAKDK